MSIYTLQAETWEDTCSEDANGLRITKKNIAIASSRHVSASQIQAALGQQYGAIGERNTRLSNVSVVRAKTSDIDRYFDITLTYEAPPEDDTTGGGDDPNNAETQRHRKLTTGYGYESRVLDPDANGKPMVNSAGMLFRDPPMFDYTYFTLTLNDRVAFNLLDLSLLAAYRDRINDGAFFGFGIGQVRLIELGLTSGFEKGKAYCDVSLQFAIKDSWDIPIKDTGTHKAKQPVTPGGAGGGVGGSVGGNFTFPTSGHTHILDQNGIPISEPVPFNGAGEPLQQGQPFVWIKFTPMQTADFSKLLKALTMPTTVAGYGV